MKKNTLNVAIAIALSATAFASTSAHSAVMSIDQGVKIQTSYVSGKGITITNTYTQGSWFSMDANGDGSVASGEITPIGGFDGLSVNTGTTQSASGSHGGAPGCTFDAGACSVGFQPAVVDDPLTTTIDETAAAVPGVAFTETPGIDKPWLFFSNTGMSFTTSPVNAFDDNGPGTAKLDFSGWRVTWAGIPEINMGGDAVNFDPALNDGIANMSCYTSGSYDAAFPFALNTGASTECLDGAFYVLDYNATVPLGDASGFGGVPYVLHLEGNLTGDVWDSTAVPVPAAAWLFGSGLLGLVGVARRRKA